jgi:hypothetical protein
LNILLEAVNVAVAPLQSKDDDDDKEMLGVNIGTIVNELTMEPQLGVDTVAVYTPGVFTTVVEALVPSLQLYTPVEPESDRIAVCPLAHNDDDVELIDKVGEPFIVTDEVAVVV